jgi:sugar phosphate isomerase/epimerase
MKLGVQSWCLREFPDHHRVAALVREIGLDRIELCDVHADFRDPDAFAGVVETYQRAGVKIVSIGVQALRGDRDTERRWFDCLAAARAAHLSAHVAFDSYQKALPIAAELAERYGVRIGLHCHGGWMFGGQPDVLAGLLKLGGERFAINLDTAWCLQLGPRFGDPVKWVTDRFPGRISMIHFKDFTFDRNGQWRDAIVGEGNLNLARFTPALQQTGFSGEAILEYDGCPTNPVPALRRCRERIEAAMALETV